ncbi:MAG: ParB/RepB/Spo0J family partition protein [Ignavibacteria bacterium]|jgi:ParB family chromosome partitioning protein|nr:ParB/RepB/Spo0J family partition protein [Ignavibacteria bacterium]
MSNNKFRPGLGRGLDALISPNLQNNNNNNLTVPANEIKPDDGQAVDILAKIPLSSISPNPYQPRIEFDPAALEELKKSILANGLIQPVTVRRVGPQKYELISGERRFRACTEIGYKEIPAYIIKVETKEAMLALALIENIQREKLNAIEVAQAYKRLIDECSLSQEEIAEQVGKDRSTITNSIRLLKLPREIQDSLIKEQISPGHARALINLPNEAFQLDLLKKIVKENLTVRKVEELVKKLALGSQAVKKARSGEVQNTVQSVSQRDLEDRLRKIFGTKVTCRQKQDGTGEVIIEFYSNDELERLYEMFEIIGKMYN